MSKKLITLHSTSNDGIFDCDFNDDIVINADSEVAFQSCSLAIKRGLVVNHLNNLFTFKIGAAAANEVRLMSGTYDRDNVNSFLVQFQNAVNRQLDINVQQENGQECEVNYDFGNDFINDIVIKIRSSGMVKMCENGDFAPATDGATENAVALVGGATFTRDTGSSLETVAPESWVGLYANCLGGCGAAMVEISSITTQPGGDAFALVLSAEQPDENGSSYTKLNDFQYYIRCPQNTAQPYEFTRWDNRIKTRTAFTSLPTTGDTIAIELSQGQLFACIYRNAVAVERRKMDNWSYSDVLNEDTEYFCSTIIYGAAAHLELTNFVVQPSSKYIGLSATTFTAAGVLGQDPPPHVGAGNNVYEFEFDSAALALQLGFETNAYVTHPTRIGKWLADNDFKLGHLSHNYKIEMLNMNLESYDSKKEARMNILSIIPATETQQKNMEVGFLQYEPNNIISLSLRNKEKQAIRNIRCRVIDYSNDSVEMSGYSSITILLLN